MAVILVGGLGWLLDILLKKRPSEPSLVSCDQADFSGENIL